MILLIALAQDLAEIEVARGEKPKAACVFTFDEDRYELEEAWGEGKTPRLPKPPMAFGAMTRGRACAWTLDVLRNSFEAEWTDLAPPENGPDTLNGKPSGWSLDFLQTYKGVAFYDPDEAGERAGVLAMLSDDLSGGDVWSARIRVRRWAVLKEHGPSRKVVKDPAPGPLKDFARRYPRVQGRPEAETVLCWAVKPGAAERRIPIWHVTVSAPDGMKPQLHRYRVDAWTGAILSSRETAIPGRIVPDVPVVSPPKKP